MEQFFQIPTWEHIYSIWKRRYTCLFGTMSNTLPECKTVKTRSMGWYKPCTYDWIYDDVIQNRIKNGNGVDVAAFVVPEYKGSSFTAEMIMNAQDDEERVAIWIAATSRELISLSHEMNLPECRRDIVRILIAFDVGSSVFLREKGIAWHHAMRRLVPQILVPYSLIKAVSYNANEESVMDLIDVNMILLMQRYKIIHYSHVEER